MEIESSSDFRGTDTNNIHMYIYNHAMTIIQQRNRNYYIKRDAYFDSGLLVHPPSTITRANNPAVIMNLTDWIAISRQFRHVFCVTISDFYAEDPNQSQSRAEWPNMNIQLLRHFVRPSPVFLIRIDPFYTPEAVVSDMIFHRLFPVVAEFGGGIIDCKSLADIQPVLTAIEYFFAPTQV